MKKKAVRERIRSFAAFLIAATVPFCGEKEDFARFVLYTFIINAGKAGESDDDS